MRQWRCPQAIAAAASLLILRWCCTSQWRWCHLTKQNACLLSAASRALASTLHGRGGGRPEDLARVCGERAKMSGGWIGLIGSPLLHFCAGRAVHGLPSTGPVPASNRGLSVTGGPSGIGPAQLPLPRGGSDAGRSGLSVVVGLAPSAYGAPAQTVPVLNQSPCAFTWMRGRPR